MANNLRKPTAKEIRNAAGKCYENAFRYMAKLSDDKVETFRLVHGEMIGRSGEVKNIQFGHAWIEAGDMVIDPGNDLRRKPQIAPKKLYYNYHRVIEKSIRRYTQKEMYGAGRKTGGNYGPWK